MLNSNASIMQKQSYNPFGHGTTYESLSAILTKNGAIFSDLRDIIHCYNPKISDPVITNVLPKFACPKHQITKVLKRNLETIDDSYNPFVLPKYGFCDGETCADGRSAQFKSNIKNGVFSKIAEYNLNDLTDFNWASAVCLRRIKIEYRTNNHKTYSTDIDFHHYATKTFKRQLQPKTDRKGRFSYVIGNGTQLSDGTECCNGSAFLQLSDDIIIEISIFCGDTNNDPSFDCLKQVHICGAIGYTFSNQSISQQLQQMSTRQRRKMTSTTIPPNLVNNCNSADTIIPCVIFRHLPSDSNDIKDEIWRNHSKIKIYQNNSNTVAGRLWVSAIDFEHSLDVKKSGFPKSIEPSTILNALPPLPPLSLSKHLPPLSFTVPSSMTAPKIQIPMAYPSTVGVRPYPIPLQSSSKQTQVVPRMPPSGFTVAMTTSVPSQLTSLTQWNWKVSIPSQITPCYRIVASPPLKRRRINPP